MSDTTRLGIDITARDGASATLRGLQQNIKGLESQLQGLTALQANASDKARASLERETMAIRQKIQALNEEAAAVLRNSAAGLRAAQQEADYINRNMDLVVRKSQAEIRARNELARAARKAEEDAARFEAENIQRSMALQEAATRQRIAQNNARVYAEQAAEDRLARQGMADTRSAAFYENRDRDLAAAQLRAEAEYENNQLIARAAQQRTEAELENTNRDSAYAQQRAAAEYEYNDRIKAMAQARAEAEYEYANRIKQAQQVRDEAELENINRDRAYANMRAEAELENINKDRAYLAMRAEADYMNRDFDLSRRRTRPGAEESGGRYRREAVHAVSFMDSLASGHRGQAISSIGAAARDAGFGVTALAGSMGALLAVMTTGAILRGAETMGRWATETRAAASAAGMSVNAYSQLQGALTLTGLKATEADATLRRLATNVGTAMEDPTSKAAEAFHALGVSQEQLLNTGGDTAQVLRLLADAFTRTADGANKTAAMEAILGRGFESLNPLLEKGSAGLDEATAKAQALGLALDEKTSKSLQQTGQSVDELEQHIRGAGISSMEAWGGTIQSITGMLTGFVDILNSASAAVGRLASALGGMSTFSLLTAPLAPLLGGGGPAAAPGGTPSNIYRQLGGAGPMDRRGDKDVVPALTGITAMEVLKHNMATAGFAASQGGGDASAIRLRVAKAELAEINKTLETAQLSTKQRDEIQTMAMQRRIELASKEAGAGASAAKQSYEDFANAEKLKIAEADGSSQKIKAIYDEWIAAANSKYRQHASVVEQIEREKVQAINKARLQEIDETARHSGQMMEMSKLDAQMAVLQSGRTRAGGPSADLAAAASFRAEAGQVDAAAASIISQLQQVMSTAEQGSDVYKQAQEKIVTTVIDAKQKELQLYQSAAEATREAVKKMAEPFVQFFDQLGSEFQNFSRSIITSFIAPQKELIKAGFTTITHSMRGSEINQALAHLFTSAIGSVGSAIQNALSKTIANALSGGASNSIGQLLGNWLSKAFSSIIGNTASSAIGNAAGSAVSSAASSTAITAAVTAGAGTTTAAITAGFTTSTTALLAGLTTLGGIMSTGFAALSLTTLAAGANPEIFGFKFSRGGVVPSAAGGMVVGGTGGSLAIVHAQEMVLPAPISRGLQAMIGRNGNTFGNATLNSTVNFNGPGRGRQGTGMSRSEFSTAIGLHGGALLGEARNMFRSGWRPA